MNIMSKETNTPINHVMMIRAINGDGPHPIHPNEVEDYRQGGWVLAEMEPTSKRTAADYSRQELFAIAKEYSVETRPTMKDEELISAIRDSAVCALEQASVSEAVAKALEPGPLHLMVQAIAKAKLVRSRAKVERFRADSSDIAARLQIKVGMP